jgi:murein DD-endopeptidase MepM/ murein hydrolase activator NlpD
MMAKKSFRRFEIFAVSIFVLAGSAVRADILSPPSASPAPGLSATLSRTDVPDGALERIDLSLPAGQKADKIEGKFEESTFTFFPDGSGGYQAVFGVPHDHKPEASTVQVMIDGKTTDVSFKIVDAKYPSETLHVDPKKVVPPKKVMARIGREVAEVGKIYATETHEKYWSGPFVYPIESPVTSVFGTKRVYNGEKKGYHGGLDLKAPIGTPIHAAAPGVVVLAKELYFTGNTVMIDHGYGVITLYAHMSELKVKVGDKVDTKTLLGLSGKTGRVTGPHLHWQAVIHKVKVNPADLTQWMK